MELKLADALAMLEPHLDALYSFPLKAWDRYQAVPEDFRMVFCKRTRASAVHNLMLKEAAGYADSTDHVRWFKCNKLYGLVINEILAIRLKKLNSKKLPSNHRTKQVIDFRSQCHIEGIDAIHNLEIGYNLDLLEKAISEVYVVYPSGLRSNFWAFELTRDKVSPVVEDIFGNREDDEIKPAVIKPKQGAIILPFRKEERGGSTNGKNDDDQN